MALSYLPNIDSERLFRIFLQRDWDQLNHVLSNNDFERIGFDRLFIILSDLYKRFGNTKMKILDVGCNNGLFSYALAALGHEVTGVDSGIINCQKRYDALQFMDTSNHSWLKLAFVDSKIEDYLATTDKQWDCILLLSILHQLEGGYAFDETSKYVPEKIKELVSNLFSRGNKIIYYECPYDEPGFEMLSGLHFLDKYLTNRNCFSIEEIAKTVGPNGVIRQMYAIVLTNKH